jgi:hypothetical protein
MESILNEFEESLPYEKRNVMSLIRMRVSPSTFVTDLLKFGWRVGRSEMVKVLIAGQNLKASVLGVTIQDLQQLPFIYLGAAINEGLENRVHSWQKSSLEQEYEHRSRLVTYSKASPFYGLFVPKGSKQAYFATLPAPQQHTPAPPESLDTPTDQPHAPTSPQMVQELERLWALPSEPRTSAENPCTDLVQRQYDPLEPENSRELINLVLKAWDTYKS